MTKASLLILLTTATAASAATPPPSAQVFGVPLNNPCATVQNAFTRAGLQKNGTTPDGRVTAYAVARAPAAPFDSANSVQLTCNDPAQQPVEVKVTLASVANASRLRETLRLPADSGWSVLLLNQGTQAIAVFRRTAVAPRT